PRYARRHRRAGRSPHLRAAAADPRRYLVAGVPGRAFGLLSRHQRLSQPDAAKTGRHRGTGDRRAAIQAASVAFLAWPGARVDRAAEAAPGAAYPYAYAARL